MDTTLSRTTVILCPRLDLSMTKTALLLIDIQNDFIPPNGSLAVNGGDQILTAVYRILDEAADHFDLVVASLACLTDLRVAFLPETDFEAFRTVCAADVAKTVFISYADCAQTTRSDMSHSLRHTERRHSWLLRYLGFTQRTRLLRKCFGQTTAFKAPMSAPWVIGSESPTHYNSI